MMTSDKQLHANRLNALRSTGPRTAEGKAASSLNAVSHGLTATKIAIRGEDERHYEALRAQLFDEYAPASLAEEILVDRLAGFVWRLRRVPAFEAALHAWFETQQEKLHDRAPLDAVDEFINPPSSQSLVARRIYGRTEPPLAQANDVQLKVGRTLEAMLVGGDVLSKLARYEGHLLKQARETVKELELLAAHRRRSDDAGDGQQAPDDGSSLEPREPVSRNRT